MKSKHQFFCLITSILLIILLTSCSSDENQSVVSIKQQKNNIQQLEKQENTLHFAILSNVSVKETYRTHYHFIQALETQLNTKIEIIQKNTYGEILDIFESGEVDIGFVCGYLAVLGSEKGLMEKIATPIVNGNTQYTSYIITKSDRNINTIDELKGKKFAFSDPYSFAGFMVPKYLIEQKGYDFDQFFEKTYFTYSHDHSISSVVNGLVDGAVIYSTTYEKLRRENNPLIKQIKVIEKGAYVGNHPIVVNPKLNSSTKNKIKNTLLTMQTNKDGRDALAQLNYDKFIEVNESLYSSILAVLKEMDEIE